MPLKPGTRLGPYEILAQLGAGGMGEVYKARDTRLERFVAIKVLPDHLADDPELRERFEREARTIAQLNHPHICTLHDIGSQDDTDFLVMEYLEGETLAERLKKGPLPLDQVLRYAVEVSDALDKAHRAGVTHRDIKPGNVIVTKSGTKLLDFGLAKLKQDIFRATTPASEVPTVPGALTEHGTLLGTLHYMAPEQVEGKVNEIGARTDIFAFGALVYEMATGKRAFPGDNQASVIAKILEVDPPPMSELQPPGKMTPPVLDRVVKTCLAKAPDERWQTARDLWRELKWIGEGGSQASVPTVAAAIPKLGWRQSIPMVLTAVVALIIGGLAVWNLRPAPRQPVTRTAITLPPGQRLAGLDQPAISISPDGNLLAYIAAADGVQQLYLRPLDNLEARPIPGTEGAISPFFSPDSQWVGFFAEGKLKKVSVSGGTALTLGDASTPRGASWSSHGMIAFSPMAVSPLQQVSEMGGAPQPLTSLGGEGTVGEDVSHRWPEFLPGGKALLFARAENAFSTASGQIAVQSLETGERRDLIGGTYPRFTSSGHLLFAQRGTLMAAPFDPRRLEVTASPVPVVEGVLFSSYSGVAQYSLSDAGSLVYAPGDVQGSQSRMVWVSHNGEEQLLAAPPRSYVFPRLSPDGGRVATGIGDQEMQNWLYDLARDTLTRWTFEGSFNVNVAWTPDGERLAYQSNSEGPRDLFWQRADGSGGRERLTTSENNTVPNSWTPDGKFLAFMEVNSTTGFDLWILDMDGRKAQPFLRTEYGETAPNFSPDGHWLAYASNESGRWEIYVQPFPGPGGKWQISTEGGTEPVWNPKGGELFYRSGDAMMAVDVTTTPSFSPGRPRMLFDASAYLPTPATFPNYDVSPDGQRFLMLKPSEQGAVPTQINVVLNWFEELKRRVPVGQ